MLRHALERGHEVVGVCREQSVDKLGQFEGRVTVIPGPTDDAAVMKKAVAGCDARLVFSCGWHVSLDGQDVCGLRFKAFVKAAGLLGRVTRTVDLDDQVEACRLVFESDTRWSGARQRPGGRRERGSTGVEPARRRPDPGEQRHPKDRLRRVPGRYARKR